LPSVDEGFGWVGALSAAAAHVVGVFIEAQFDEGDEVSAEVGAGQLRRVVLGDEEQRPHRVQVGVGRLTLGQLDRRYTQTPDVDLQRQRPFSYR